MMTRPEKETAAHSESEVSVTSIPLDGFEAKAMDETSNSSIADASIQEGVSEFAEDVPPEKDASTDELVQKAEVEMLEWRDKYMRLHAEWDTYRRRTAEQRAEERVTATEKLVCTLLPVIDDFERTIDYAEKNGEKGLLDGVRAVQTKLVDTLVKEGVEVLNPLDNAFEALEAQAISSHKDANVPNETVTEVFQKGYKMGRKVLRPAMVKVATGGPQREKEQEEGKE